MEKANKLTFRELLADYNDEIVGKYGKKAWLALPIAVLAWIFYRAAPAIGDQYGTNQ